MSRKTSRKSSPLKKAWKTKVRKNLSKGVGGNHKPTIGNTKNVPVLFFRRLRLFLKRLYISQPKLENFVLGFRSPISLLSDI